MPGVRQLLVLLEVLEAVAILDPLGRLLLKGPGALRHLPLDIQRQRLFARF